MAGSQLRRSQEELLLEVLARNRDSDFGRRHGFGEIGGPGAFRRRVPLADYESYRADVERMAAGERGVLTSERTLAFFKTSGSASRPKLIPVTPSLVRQKSRAFARFWQRIYRDHPQLEGGRWIANFADHADDERTSGGLAVRSETGFWNERMQGFQPRDRWPVPPALRHVGDGELRHFAAARFALQVPLDGILSLNPSTLVVFARGLERHREALLDGLEKGELGWPGEVAPETLERLALHLQAQPEVARELRRRLAGIGEAIPWRRLWPGLALVVCWQSRPVEPYLRLLGDALEGVARRDYITQASEAIVAIPERDGESGGRLASGSHFFEFIPEAEAETAEPATLLAHELAPGEVYEVVVTTGGGLYRYRLGDCLRCHRFEDGVPFLEHLYRRGRTSSMTGEKLTERQVEEAAAAADRELGFGPEQRLCFPRASELPAYGLLVASSAGSEPLGRWLGAFEAALAGANSEYADKRASGRLGPPVALEVAPEAFDHLRRRLAAERRVSEEQLKLGALLGHLDLDRELDRELRVQRVIHARP